MALGEQRAHPERSCQVDDGAKQRLNLLGDGRSRRRYYRREQEERPGLVTALAMLASMIEGRLGGAPRRTDRGSGTNDLDT